MMDPRPHPSRTPDVVASVIAEQAAWARRAGLEVDHVRHLLIDRSSSTQPAALTEETRAELAVGSGRELDRLHSLRSSACLAVNVFGPWRPSPAPVAAALGWELGSEVEMLFEQRHRTGLGGPPPHLDVVLRSPVGLIGVECKFLEPYRPHTISFSDSYFTRPRLWSRLPRLEELAREMAYDPRRYRWLAADQLVKHALGLANSQPKPFCLRLVWYRTDHPATSALEDEIGRFSRDVRDSIDFEAITYQELVGTLVGSDEPTPGYFDYLADRYSLPGMVRQAE